MSQFPHVLKIAIYDGGVYVECAPLAGFSDGEIEAAIAELERVMERRREHGKFMEEWKGEVS